MTRAIHDLEARQTDQPSLSDIAARMGLSEGHFQKLFRRWVGISPKRFLQYVTAAHARELLASSGSVLDAAIDTGLSGPGRLHDLTVHVDALSPGEMRRGGEGVEIRHGMHDTPLGPALLAVSPRGVVALSFDDDLDRVQRRWPRATFREDRERTAPVANALFDGGQVSLHLRGTNFQIRVWEALLRIPEGRAVSYGDVAAHLDMPSGARAVGNAVGANPVAFWIPCHRVLRETGAFGGYRWGIERKRAILAWERARQG